ncbi:NDR1/HIN1-Like protein 3-like [Canna indica]|uniref:NDR1/HIN1-Like protein 3-like n=1 Tax=Canna indica TaxID=4628 RepID=A0AAQ3KGE7_9LILI|nr:NDR1/HIN1-Like protein 3-like [Canna indica]
MQLSADAAAGRVELRVELNVLDHPVQSEDMGHPPTSYHLHVECNVVVSSDGSLLPGSRNMHAVPHRFLRFVNLSPCSLLRFVDDIMYVTSDI